MVFHIFFFLSKIMRIERGVEVLKIRKFTQKTEEAINDCEKLAYEYGNQEIEQEHLMVALMQQEDGLIEIN